MLSIDDWLHSSNTCTCMFLLEVFTTGKKDQIGQFSFKEWVGKQIVAYIYNGI